MTINVALQRREVARRSGFQSQKTVKLDARSREPERVPFAAFGTLKGAPSRAQTGDAPRPLDGCRVLYMPGFSERWRFYQNARKNIPTTKEPEIAAARAA